MGNNCEYHGDCVIECTHPKQLCRLYERVQTYNGEHRVDMNPTEMLWAMVETGELSELEVEAIMEGVNES